MDIGSSVNLFTLEVYNKLSLDKNILTKVFYLLLGLGDKIVPVLDTINLLLVLGDKKYKQEVYVEFSMVDILPVYNVILGRLILNYHRILINIGFYVQSYQHQRDWR